MLGCKVFLRQEEVTGASRPWGGGGLHAMKRTRKYRKMVPVKEVLQHPKACFVQNIFTPNGSAVLVPNKVPICDLVASLPEPERLIRSLESQGIREVELEFRHPLDVQKTKALLEEIDSSFRVVDAQLSSQVVEDLSDIYSRLTIDQKFHFPRGEVERLGGMLAEEVGKATHILMSLVNPETADTYTQTHSLNVSLLSGYLAKRLCELKGFHPSLVEKAIQAGLLFDLGKATLPREILEKPEPLGAEELRIVRSHPAESVRIARASGVSDPDILEGILHHHERWDGSGYPDGLTEKKIPVIARILAVADTFDAMTSQRVYKNAVSSKVSFNFIMSANETHFDPDVCRVFLSGMGIYPPGCVVELSDGTVGTVAASTEGNLLQPKILLQEGDQTRIIELCREAHRNLFIKRALDV